MDRMQRHLGSAKGKPSIQLQSVTEVPPYTDPNALVLQAYIAETEGLRKQVAELQVQLTEKRAQRRSKQEPIDTETPAPTDIHQETQRPQPKAWFCFKCGDNGHIARQCENPPNRELVNQKNRELKVKQDEWKARYGQQLN